ncbi:DNA primase [Acetilactobacillus jinshanensis]|uniref:DNA primase n=1 Tax=Acetilactobacillus jinshanensis TaxID=1720083 RepID=A0A4P6ZK17_9LACO|nr:DNA primase [Acetilactobacillus jinshanensis]QBP17988.1 DNA primase [Acetilactobacillus jinshanensis]URL60850.1 DNA primase [uncultured bacterium]
MAMIPNDVIDKVRSQAKIEDIVGKYVHLSRSGKNLFAHCPFHEDQTPSFCVSPQRQIFHCFSCGRGGNVFDFLMEMKNMSFPQSVTAVAKDEGINLSGRYLQRRPKRPVNKFKLTLIKMYDKVAQLYHHILIDTEAGQPALDYLHRRGLTDDTINAYNLGFAPQQPLLKTLFAGQQLSPTIIQKSGLFIQRQNGEMRDRFFNRVMYPIRNQNGQTIAFSGRVLNKKASPAKYLNSPETPIFHKRDVIFNLDKAKATVKKVHTVILFEGYMDVMSAYQSGVKNGIASMGTSLTGNQIKDIEAISRKVLVCYDGDEPGQKAINRAVNILMPTRLQVGVIQMPNGIDPDEYRQKYGEKQFYHYVHSAQETPTTFRLRFLKRGRNLNNQHDQLAYLKDALRVIAQVRSSVNRDVYLNGLAHTFHVKVQDLQGQIANLVRYYQKLNQYQHVHHQSSVGRAPQTQVTELPKPAAREELAEQILLKRMLFDHNIWLEVTSRSGFKFFDLKYQMLYEVAEGYLRLHKNQYDPHGFEQFADRANLTPLAKQINSLDLSKQINNSGIQDCVKIIMMAPLKKKLKKVKQDLQDAASRGDTTREQQDTQKVIEIIRKLRGLKNG